MTVKEKAQKAILKNPALSNKEIAAICGTTAGTVTDIRVRMRKAGLLPKLPAGWRRKEPVAKMSAKPAPVQTPAEEIKPSLKALLKTKKKYTIESLSDHFNTGVGNIRAALEGLKAEGFNVVIKDGHAAVTSEIPKAAATVLDVRKMSTGFFKFGAIGDNHMGSKYERLDVLNALYDLYEKEGVKVVYNTGNWIDGEARFNTHDLKIHGMDNQLDYFIEKYPRRKGITTYFVAGDDHEGWYTQREGVDIGKAAELRARAAGRTDLVYLGYMEADVVLPAKNGQTIIRVLHPGGGSSYAVSYSVQKIIESYQGGEKPHVLLLGHYHKADYIYNRGVHAIQTGCFIGNTKIQTSSGIKKIKDIQIGDMVLTHLNRYRHVTSLMKPRKAADFWRLNYGRKNRQDQTITATSEHPFLVERNGVKQWLPIRLVIPGDRVFILPANCKLTGEKIPYWMRLSKNANPMNSPEIREKLSAVRGGFKKKRTRAGSGHTHLDRDILPFCDKMKAEGWEMVPVGAGVIPDAIGYKDGKIVAFEVERRTGKMLEFKQKKYEGSKILDFVDDVQWISISEPKEQFRSFYELDESGFVKVEVFSCEPCDISKRQRKCETVYNFEVEEDNSYVAGNVVVHNCTQDQSPFMRKKKLAAHLGGWIIEMATDDNGAVTRFKQEFMPFYDNGYYQKWAYKWK